MDTIETNEKILTKEEKLEKIYDWALKALWVGVNVLLLVAYLAGFCVTNGKKMTALSLIGQVRDVLSMRWIMWYYYLGNLAHSIIYLIFGIKNVLEFKEIVKACFFRKNETHMLVKNKSFWGILSNCVTYFFFASIIAETTMTGFALFACVFALLGFMGEKVLVELLQERNLSFKYLLQKGIYIVIEGVILLLLGGFLIRPIIANAIEGVDILLACSQGKGILYGLYKVIAVEILYAVLIFGYLQLITAFLNGVELNKMYERESLFKKALIVFAIDLVAFILFVAGDSIGGTIGAVKDYFAMARMGLLQIVFLVIAEKMLSDFPKIAKYKKATNTESNENIEINA